MPKNARNALYDNGVLRQSLGATGRRRRESVKRVLREPSEPAELEEDRLGTTFEHPEPTLKESVQQQLGKQRQTLQVQIVGAQEAWEVSQCCLRDVMCYLYTFFSLGWRMRFEFCGNLPCPEWFIAESSVLTKIVQSMPMQTAIKLKLVVGYLINHLLEDVDIVTAYQQRRRSRPTSCSATAASQSTK